jgi:hypothetical protein
LRKEIEKALQFNEDTKLTELKKSVTLWQEIIPNLNSKKAEVVTKFLRAQSNTLYSSKSIREAIINLLEIKGEKGMNSVSLFSILKKSFLNGYPQIRYELVKLINDRIIVRFVKNRSNILILKKYYTERPLYHQKKVFGRPLSPPSYLEEISLLEKGSLSSTNNNQVSRFAGLFLVQYFHVRASKNEFERHYDFVAEKEDDRVYVWVDVNSQITQRLLYNLYDTLPTGSRGIIITLNKTREDIIRLSKKLNLEIWNRDVLQTILAKHSYEPCHTGMLVKVMYGPDRERYAKVRSLDFGNQTQEIQFMDDLSYAEVFFGSLRTSEPNSNISRHEDAYIYFTKILRSICSDVEFYAGIQLTSLSTRPEYHSIHTRYPNTTPVNIANKYNPLIINNFVDSCNVVIKFNVVWKGFIYIDEDNHNDTPRDFCRKYVLKCQCYYWSDQDSNTIRLCRHMIAALNMTWHKANDVNYINEGVEILRFFCHDSFILYDFLQGVAKTKHTGLYEIIKNAFLIKGMEEYKDSDLEHIITICKQKNGLRSLSFNDRSGVNNVISLGIVDNETLEKLSKINKEYPAIDEVFARLPNNYTIGCRTTLDERINEVSKSDQISTNVNARS